MIRPATPADCPTIFEFICELAEYEKLRHEVVGSVEELQSHLFAENTFAKVLIAEDEDGPLGFALFFTTYSTFLCRPGIYLEDLYVTPAKRGFGHGKALMIALAKYAVENGFGRFEWAALNWNTPAIDFYKALGAVGKYEWSVYRLDGPNLNSVAEVTLNEPDNRH